MSTETAVGRMPTWLIVMAVPVLAGIAVLVTALVSGGGGSGTTARSGAAANNTVDIKNFSFSPNRINVKPGTAITVVNDDNTTHTFTANNGAFDTGDLNRGRRRRVTLVRAGTYAYHCEIHPFMKGTVQVSP